MANFIKSKELHNQLCYHFNKGGCNNKNCIFPHIMCENPNCCDTGCLKGHTKDGYYHILKKIIYEEIDYINNKNDNLIQLKKGLKRIVISYDEILNKRIIMDIHNSIKNFNIIRYITQIIINENN